jgi:TPR repeat protein
MTDSETPSSEESFAETLARAEAGDIDAQYNLGVMYAEAHCAAVD